MDAMKNGLAFIPLEVGIASPLFLSKGLLAYDAHGRGTCSQVIGLLVSW